MKDPFLSPFQGRTQAQVFGLTPDTEFPLSAIFFAIVLIAFVVAGFRQVTWTPAPVSLDAPKTAEAAE